MTRRNDRRLTAGLVAATTVLGLLVAAPAARAVGSPTTLDVWPHCAPERTAVDVEAFANDVYADDVTFLLDDAEVGSGHNDDGNVEATLQIPARASGTYTVEMRSADDDDPIASATFRVPCFSVTATPDRVALRGGRLTLRLTADGYDYPRNYDYPTYPVVFRLDGAIVATADQDDDGHVSTIVDLPAVPDCSSHPVVADFQQPPVGEVRGVTESRTTLVVTCPNLTPEPATVAKAALPTGIQVSGDGWDAGRDVELSVDGAVLATASTGKDGRFTTTLPLSARPCGTVSIEGVEVPLKAGAAAPPPVPRATTTVEVTCSRARTLVADPIVASGGVSRATGHGFTPGATVHFTWLLPEGTSAPGALETVAAADGTVTASCLVLPHARLGVRTLRADETGGGATAPVLVVTGPMEPGRNRLLGRR
jgi:hypothetical protein